EADIAHLRAAAQVYDDLSAQPNWVTIECVEASSGSLRAPDAIHQEIWAAIGTRIPAALGARG
ncbi:MAG TPA: hypothetical protein VN745_07670, partial [Verrucomicrobiae bacterium]|nr:hypothetical protein [Verrucomicrobiae bacterium]